MEVHLGYVEEGQNSAGGWYDSILFRPCPYLFVSYSWLLVMRCRGKRRESKLNWVFIEKL